MTKDSTPTLHLDNSKASLFIETLKNYLRAKIDIQKQEDPSRIFPFIDVENETTIFGAPTVALYLCETFAPSIAKQLTGSLIQQEETVKKWLSVCNKSNFSFTQDQLEEIESSVTNCVYLVGPRICVADVALYISLLDWIDHANFDKLQTHPSICRYFDHIQHLPGINFDGLPLVNFEPLFTSSLKDLLKSAKKGPRKEESPKEEKSKEKGEKNEKPKEEKSKEKGARKDDKPKEEKSKEKAKEKKTDVIIKLNDDGIPCDAEGRPWNDPTRIELRVGFIKKAWEHPKANRLYCEEVDVGAEQCRTIASGLKQFKTLEEMQEQPVVVIANLPPKKMFKFDSHGMLLCASKDDKVDFVRPPKNSKPGDLLFFQGLAGPHDNVLCVSEGANTFGLVQPFLKSDDEGVAKFSSHRIISHEGEPCISAITGGTLS
eukprot:GHVP01032211.1.p1 GENE.GHVP01032211.1~~GHVP01032211.1.p1  ORF type:complete len:445 (+),score=100.25 GHVP01032211.1:44-1336(+)